MKCKKSTSRKLIFALIIVALLVAVDQITKMLAASALQAQPFTILPGVFELRYLENRGAAFGILQGRQWFFIILSSVFACAAMFLYMKTPDTRRMKMLRVCLIFLTAGALGNFIDRVVLGYVRDFFYFSLINFPIFNVADIYVSVTAVVLAIYVIFIYHDNDFAFLKKRKEKDVSPEEIPKE